MKKIVSLVLALSMVLSMFTFAFAGTTLKDVAEQSMKLLLVH